MKNKKTFFLLMVFLLSFMVLLIMNSQIFPITAPLKENDNIKSKGSTSYSVQWLKNPTFTSPIQPIWYSTKSGDLSDSMVNDGGGQANITVIGKSGNAKFLAGPGTYSLWKPSLNPDYPLGPWGNDRYGPNPGNGTDSAGFWVNHVWSEGGGQLGQTPSILWKRNVTMPVNMTDYQITSVSLRAIINGTVRQDVDCPGPPPDTTGGGASSYDYARFFITISTLSGQEKFELAYNKTKNLGLGNGGSTAYSRMGDTLMINVPEALMKVYLEQVLATDHYNFTISLGIFIYCEDNNPTDTDSFIGAGTTPGLRIKSFNLTISYAKKISQGNAMMWNQKGNQLPKINETAQFLKVDGARLQFKYRSDRNWTTDSPNSELRILMNNQTYPETIKLSKANRTYQEAKTGGFDVASYIMKNVNISVGIQVYIADAFVLSRNITISIDDAYLWINYTIIDIPPPQPPSLNIVANTSIPFINHWTKLTLTCKSGSNNVSRLWYYNPLNNRNISLDFNFAGSRNYDLYFMNQTAGSYIFKFWANSTIGSTYSSITIAWVKPQDPVLNVVINTSMPYINQWTQFTVTCQSGSANVSRLWYRNPFNNANITLETNFEGIKIHYLNFMNETARAYEFRFWANSSLGSPAYKSIQIVWITPQSPVLSIVTNSTTPYTNQWTNITVTCQSGSRNVDTLWYYNPLTRVNKTLARNFVGSQIFQIINRTVIAGAYEYKFWANSTLGAPEYKNVLIVWITPQSPILSISVNSTTPYTTQWSNLTVTCQSGSSNVDTLWYYNPLTRVNKTLARNIAGSKIFQIINKTMITGVYEYKFWANSTLGTPTYQHIIIIWRNITALLEYQPPGSTPYAEGSYVSVYLRYSDIVNNLPITNATGIIYYIVGPSHTPLSPFTKALGNYSVIDQGTGWYLVKLFMGTNKLYTFGSYYFSIRFNKTNYDIRSISNISFTIRQGYSQFTSPYAPLAYVINGIVNITINYIDSETGLGIVNTSSGAQVLLKWTWPYNSSLHPAVMNTFGWSNSLNRWVVAGYFPMGDGGRYIMQMNFTSIPVGNWTLMSLNITAGRIVQSQVLNITFITQPQTSIIGITFAQPVVWGINSQFNVTYQKVDGTGIPGTGLNLWDLDAKQSWNPAYWSYYPINPAIGLFGVTVNTTLYPPPLGGFFRIRVEASGGAYTPRSLTAFVNVRPIDSQVVLTPPTATGWNTRTNITIQYYDFYHSRPINDSNINDATGVIIRVTNINPAYWKLYRGTANGYYIVEVNTSYWPTLNQIGQPVYIDIKWAGPPYYNNWTGMQVGVPVRGRNTQLLYVPAVQIPYGENATITFIWQDIEGITKGIDNTTGKVVFELRDWLNRRWNSSGFAWIIGLGNGQYELCINSSKIPSIGSYTFTAYFKWLGQPYYSNSSTTFTITIRQINTILTYNVPSAVPWGNPFQIVLQFNVSDTSSSLNGRYISGAMLNITSISNSGGSLSPFSYGLNYTVADNGFGRYILTIFNKTLNIDSFSLILRASRYRINIIYRNASASFSFTVRPLTTMLTYTSPIPQPWGNQVNISLSYMVSDAASFYWNGRSLAVGIWRLTNGTLWTQGIQYKIFGTTGAYIVNINNKTVYGAKIGTFQFSITTGTGNNRFLNATLTNLPFTIRALTTTLTYIPSATQPFGNNVSLIVFYNITDPSSLYYNKKGLNANIWTLSNSSGSWTSGTQYQVTGSNGAYNFTIFRKVYKTIGTFIFNIQANASNARYDIATCNDIPFTIRALTTALTYIPTTPVPFGNNITLLVFYNVSDSASLIYNGLGLNVTTWSLSNTSGSWKLGNQFLVAGSKGAYTFTILRKVYSDIGTYRFNLQASPIDSKYENATILGLPFTIRQLSTVLTYDPIRPIPWGNDVNVSVHIRVSDPESTCYDRSPVPIDHFNILSPGIWIEGDRTNGNFTWTGYNGDYIITIFNTTRSNVGRYNLSLLAVPLLSDNWHSQVSFYNIPYSVRALNTLLIYPSPAKSPWGNNATSIVLKWQVIDLESSYHNNELIIGGRIIVTNPANWTYWRDYASKDLLNGNYLLNISKNIVNKVQTYIINLKAYSLTGNYYANITYIGLPFSIVQVFTSHTTIINSIYYLDAIGGRPWGEQVNVTILYRDLDHSSLVPNSNITIQGDNGSPYKSGNFTINGLKRTVMGSLNGIFYLIINGTVAENAVGYNFHINLSHPTGYYLNHSYIFTISFRKAVSQIIPKNPPVNIPWGDTLSIIFTYNNSEAGGFPGIADAYVNVTTNKDAIAKPYYIYYANLTLGPGAWIIKMNTTWANVAWNQQDQVTFTMTAVAPGTIIAQSFHTVFITPLDADLKMVPGETSFFLEQIKTFNITVELRDRSHNLNLIANNSYWMGPPSGSQGQYANIKFIIISGKGQFTNYTWYWGNISITALSVGVYKFTFFFNQTGYPRIQELLNYPIGIEVRGDRLTSSQISVQINLKIQTHKTSMTFNWTYAERIAAPSYNLTRFPTFINRTKFYYGDIINIYLYWYDLDTAAPNPGISTAFISTNWTDPLYYRVFNTYELSNRNDSNRGIFCIQIDTRLYKKIIGDYTLQVNASLETYQRIYLRTHGYVHFEINPAPINLTLYEPILSIPYRDNAEIKIRVTNSHEGNAGIFLASSEIDIINIAGPMGGSKWLIGTNPLYGIYSLFFYTTSYDLGTYNATVMINKTNYELIYKNFTFIIREINTRIVLQTPQNISVTYRHSDMIRFLYMDDETYKYHIPIGTIPASPLSPNLNFNISNWYNINGKADTLKDEVAKGIYKIKINASINVGIYPVSIFIKLPYYQEAIYFISINITKASTKIEPIEPANNTPFTVYQLLTQHFSVRYITEFGESILNGTLYLEIRVGGISGALITKIKLNNDGNGIYSTDLSTNNLTAGQTYTIVVYAEPNDKNYYSAVIEETNIFTVKPFYEHWAFILAVSVLAAVVGVMTYRQIRWYLTPYQVKAIIRATKVIKKGKKEVETHVLKDRDELFKSEFSEAWVALDLKPPKLMRPEVVLFASEISAVLRTRMTTPEAESLVNTLKTLSLEDAERQLGEMKVPPEATRRLLTIIGVISKERFEVKNFAQALSNIKGIEIPYAQAEELFDHLQTLNSYEADKYLESLVIPQEDRKRLIDLVGLKPLVSPKKGKEAKVEKVKEITPEKIKEKSMTASELQAALDKIPELSAAEKESLIKDLEKLGLKEQKQILKNLQEASK